MPRKKAVSNAPQAKPGPETQQPNPEAINPEEAKRKQMLDTLARARAVRQEKLAAAAAAAGQSSRKGGSVETPPAKEPDATAVPVPPAAGGNRPAAAGQRLTLNDVYKGRVAAILVMFRED